MKTTPWIKQCKGATLALAVSFGLTCCQSTGSTFTLEQKGDSLTIVHIVHPTHYILLPIEEEADESQVRLDTGNATDTDMDIRLAQTKVDYFVPCRLIQRQPLCAFKGNRKTPSAGKKSDYPIRLILPIRINSVLSTIMLPFMAG